MRGSRSWYLKYQGHERFEARDARIAEQISHYKAAEALNSVPSYRRVIRRGISDRCPSLETEEDQLVWMMGMLAGIQAVQHDGASLRAVGVPLDVREGRCGCGA